MGSSGELLDLLRVKFESLLPCLDERQRRLLVGAEARQWGHGGIALVAKASGMSLRTVAQGVADLEEDAEPDGRVRRHGAGRKRNADLDPALTPDLLALVADSRGDPIGPLQWTTKSLRHLSGELRAAGHRAGVGVVRDLLRENGFSLQGNAKVLEGSQHPHRDRQFRHINATAAAFLAAGDPVISVDAKKKEDVGQFARNGVEWRPIGDPTKVLDHDFAGQGLGKALPYGIYNVGLNTGWVVVGTDHDTAAFAVSAIRDWWQQQGRLDHPDAKRLLITADAGGSNGHRVRAWKAELAALATETGITVHVSHMPPGTSKWNKIEHRLFSAITLNWRARPLASYETVINLISSTTTRGGLTVRARLDTGRYPTGVRIDDEHMAKLILVPDPAHDDDAHRAWNYSLPPQPQTPPPPRTPPAKPGRPPLPPPAACDNPRTGILTNPALHGMTRADLAELTATVAALHDALPHPERRGHPPVLHLHEQIWATLLYQRKLSRALIAELTGTSEATIKRTVKKLTPLITHAGHTPTPHPARIRHSADLIRHLTATTSTPS